MMTQFGKHLVTSVVIRLNLGDFLIEYFCTVHLTSLDVKYLRGRDLGGGESRYICTVFVSDDRFVLILIIEVIWLLIFFVIVITHFD